MSEVISFAASLALVLILAPIVYAFVRPVFSGAPYAPTGKGAIQNMENILKELPPSGKPRRAVDLGSGDGRIVIALAEQGFEAHGYELNPLLVWYARMRIRKAGLEGHAFIHKQSFWDADLSNFDVVTLFGISYIMDSLEQKLQNELKPGAFVLSNYFTFRSWKPTRSVERVYVYTREENDSQAT